MLGATDFFSVEVWTPRGFVTYYVLFFMELSTRRIEISGVTPSPNAAFMTQVVRNLLDCEDGFLLDKRYLIHDRDDKYTIGSSKCSKRKASRASSSRDEART